MYTKDNGEIRRGITMEVFDADAGAAMEQVAKGFAAGGYKPARDAKSDNKGRIVRSFAKKGQPSLFVQVSPASARKPENADARSSVWISWQVSPAPRRKAKAG